MKKNIITVSRQFGSGGRSVAKQLAEKLGIPYYDKEIIEMVVEKTGFHPDYVSQRGEHAPYASTFAYAFTGRNTGGMSNDDLLWKAQCHAIEELTQKGPCVILGRCADYLLRERQDAFHVFVCADSAFRAKRVVEKYGETPVKIEKRLDEKDRKRRVSYNHYTGRKWGDTSNYDLAINSASVGVDRVADLIIEAIKAAEAEA